MKGAKEMFEEVQQQEMESVDYADHARLIEQQADEQFNSIRHCGQCKRNWSSLPVQDEDGDEQYEYCPVCYTDEHLMAYSGGDTFTFCQITGEIVNDRTGHPEKVISVVPPEVPKSPQHFNAQKYEGRKEYHESQSDKALAAYHKAFATGGQAAGERAYWEVLKVQ